MGVCVSTINPVHFLPLPSAEKQRKTSSKNDNDDGDDDDNIKNSSAAAGVGSWRGYGQAGKKGEKVFDSQYNALQG